MNEAPLRLFDTMTSTVRPLALRSPGQVSMYVCGPTVYGPAHIGHGRFSLVFDVIRRYLQARGLSVTYVSNITDIDDKIITKSHAEGVSASVITERYEEQWNETMRLLGVLAPTFTPHATEYVEQMVTMVNDLVEQGAAYETVDGVYLDATRVEDYGLLAHQDLDELRAGERVEVGAKRSPLDFVLWKPAKEGEPSWDSPWGPGRPGWHTECVAMSLDLLGEGFDLHGGGQDLAFPHHENERAQATALGKSFSNHWVHNGFVVDDRENRVGKSMGNAVDLPTLLAGRDPRSYRLLVLMSHYRSPMTVTPHVLDGASEALNRLDTLRQRSDRSGVSVEPDAETLMAWQEHVEDDLATHSGVALLFDAVRAANAAFDLGDETRGVALARAVEAALGEVGLLLHATKELSPEDASLVERRDAARRERNWTESDRLRDELTSRGWKVQDTPNGTHLQ